MSNWTVYTGSSDPHTRALPPPPPWRRFPPDRDVGKVFQATPELIEAVNAALTLRRPLLLTGPAGSGKSSLIDSVARELTLGPVLRWHVTSSSNLADALYHYDAIGRLHAQGLTPDGSPPPPLSDFLRLGPVGTALMPSTRPRALLIDEIDKSDIDLPNDLLNVFERGEFEIPELARHTERSMHLRGQFGSERYEIIDGQVRCTEFPFVVLTSNGERDFPAAFLRRCIRVRVPEPTEEQLAAIVRAHLGADISERFSGEIRIRIVDFLDRGAKVRPAHLATDQLLNAIYVVTGSAAPHDKEQRQRVLDLLLKELTSDPA